MNPSNQKPAETTPQPPKLLDRVRAKMRLSHYSIRTEESYVQWITRFILFHDKRHPNTMGAAEIEEFLTHLAVEAHVAASTQNQALSALLFLYQKVLEIELPLLNAVRARRPERLPVVLSLGEVRAIFDRMDGVHLLMAQLLYGTGMRLLEACRLRVKDVDFARHQLMVRDGKGEKDRVVPLPKKLAPALEQQLDRVKSLHKKDVAVGHGRVWLPYAYAEKWPEADRELGWQYAFPSSRLSVDPRESVRPHSRERKGVLRRHHIHENMQQKMVKRAVLACGFAKRVSCHTFGTASRRTCWKRATTSARCKARPLGCQHNDDIHTRGEPRAGGGAKPARSVVSRQEPGVDARAPDVRLPFARIASRNGESS